MSINDCTIINSFYFFFELTATTALGNSIKMQDCKYVISKMNELIDFCRVLHDVLQLWLFFRSKKVISHTETVNWLWTNDSITKCEMVGWLISEFLDSGVNELRLTELRMGAHQSSR